jgi:hypothetical protein
VARTVEQTGLDARIVREFMSGDELGLFRLCSDIMINVQEVDAFSGSMCETLYAGNAMIAGAWLPYGELRRAGVHYHEVPTIADIPATLTRVLDAYPAERARASGNRDKIRRMVSWEHNAESWLNVYRELGRR